MECSKNDGVNRNWMYVALAELAVILMWIVTISELIFFLEFQGLILSWNNSQIKVIKFFVVVIEFYSSYRAYLILAIMVLLVFHFQFRVQGGLERVRSCIWTLLGKR